MSICQSSLVLDSSVQMFVAGQLKRKHYLCRELQQLMIHEYKQLSNTLRVLPLKSLSSTFASGNGAVQGATKDL